MNTTIGNITTVGNITTAIVTSPTTTTTTTINNVLTTTTVAAVNGGAGPGNNGLNDFAATVSYELTTTPELPKDIFAIIAEFYSHPNNMAMYLVLPLFILVFGGSCCFYAVAKAKKYCRKKRRSVTARHVNKNMRLAQERQTQRKAELTISRQDQGGTYAPQDLFVTASELSNSPSNSSPNSPSNNRHNLNSTQKTQEDENDLSKSIPKSMQKRRDRGIDVAIGSMNSSDRRVKYDVKVNGTTSPKNQSREKKAKRNKSQDSLLVDQKNIATTSSVKKSAVSPYPLRKPSIDNETIVNGKVKEKKRTEKLDIANNKNGVSHRQWNGAAIGVDSVTRMKMMQAEKSRQLPDKKEPISPTLSSNSYTGSFASDFSQSSLSSFTGSYSVQPRPTVTVNQLKRIEQIRRYENIRAASRAGTPPKPPSKPLPSGLEQLIRLEHIKLQQKKVVQEREKTDKIIVAQTNRIPLDRFKNTAKYTGTENRKKRILAAS